MYIITYTPWATTALSLQKTCSPPPEAAGTLSFGATTPTSTVAATGAATGAGGGTAGGSGGGPVPFGMSARAWSRGAKVPKSGFEWVEAEGCADLLLKVLT